MSQENLRVVREGVDAFAAGDLERPGQAERHGPRMSVSAAYRFERGKIAEAFFFWVWEDALAAAGLAQPD